MSAATMKRALPLLVALAFAGTAHAQVATVTPQDTGVTVRLRGISAVDANVAWASGKRPERTTMARPVARMALIAIVTRTLRS